MQQAQFLKQKISRQLQINGSEYSFSGFTTDAYHQKTTNEIIVKLVGIFHETSAYITQSGTEAATLITKPQPMILTLTEDISSITKGYKIVINGNKYRVTALHDIQNYGVVTDISLELEV